MTLFLWLLPRIAVAGVLIVLGAFVIDQRWLPRWVWRQYLAEMPLHRLIEPDTGHGAGSARIVYRVCAFDLRRGDLILEGEAPDAAYWMIGAYDRWARGRPHTHFPDRAAHLDAQGRFRLRLTLHPQRDGDELDCRGMARGMLMFRVLLPRGPIPIPAARFEPRGQEQISG